MNIHVDSRGVDLEIDEIRRLRVDGNQLLVTAHHGLVKERVTHIASVDEEKLLGTAFFGISGHTDETVDFHKRRFSGYGSDSAADTFAEQRAYALFQRAVAELMQSYIIMNQGEVDICIHKSQTLELAHYMAEFNAVFLKKLAARRHVEIGRASCRERV